MLPHDQDTHEQPYWLQGTPAVQELAQTLLTRYPAAFHRDREAVRPLKMRIDWDIRHALGVEWPVIRAVLQGYTRRRAYRAALAAPGAMRIDLQGQPVEPVTAAHPPEPYWLQGTPAVQELAHTLLTRYPAAFHRDDAAVRPLKIGIDYDIRHAVEGVSWSVIRTVLRGYVRRRTYQQALAAPGAMRLDLQGQPVEPVTAEHQQWAREGRPRDTLPQRKPRPTPTPATPAPPTPAAPATSVASVAPISDFTPYLPQGGTPMAVTATLKFVFHEIPESREQEGMVYLALQNVPKGVPSRVHLAETPLAVACTGKMWRTALKRHDDLAASGASPLWIVEANTGVHNGSLLAVVKGIQVTARSPAKEEAAGKGKEKAERPARA